MAVASSPAAAARSVRPRLGFSPPSPTRAALWTAAAVVTAWPTCLASTRPRKPPADRAFAWSRTPTDPTPPFACYRLERLPSLDLAELDTLSAVPTEPVPLNDRGDSSSASAFPSAPQRSGVGAQFAQLLRRPYAGAALSAESRGNSFDIAASSVTAPSMLRQGSFDSAYLLPMPGPAESTGPSSASTATAAGSPSGRLFLQPGNGIAELDRSGSAYVGGGGAMAGAPLSRPPRPSSADLGPDTAVPLMRQRTFDYTPPAPGTGTDIVEEDVSGKSKRKSSGGMGAEEGHSAEQDFKRAKTESAGTDIGELLRLTGCWFGVVRLTLTCCDCCSNRGRAAAPAERGRT